jgi:AraC-like DNA-binding protein
MERLLPDGTVEIVIDLRGEPKKLFRRDDYARHQAFKRSWISGKQSRYIVIESAPDSSMIGVHFKPGGTYPILGCPVSEITDQVIELDLVWGSAVNSLRDQIIEAPDVDRKFAILESFLLARCNAIPKTIGRVEYAIDQLLRSPHGMAMRDLAARIGITPKHLIGQFHKYVGLNPRSFGRICRFQNTLGFIDTGRNLRWAEVAVACGYYDQPHFNREFQHFAGLSPSSYLADKAEYPNYVPIQP